MESFLCPRERRATLEARPWCDVRAGTRTGVTRRTSTMNGRTFDRRLLVAGWMAFAAPLMLMGCGGSSAPPNCGKEQPCGGDVGGTWNFLGICTNLAVENQNLQAACAGRSISALGVSLTGQLTYNADMTYTASNWHEVFSLNETIPLSCASGTTSCAALSGTTTDSTTGMATTTTVTCSGTTVCTCHVSGNLTLTVAETGTYYIAGTTLDMTGTETSGTFPYCVEGGRLHLMTLMTQVNMPLGPEVVTTDIVAMKQ
jgi:hypothetical protein